MRVKIHPEGKPFESEPTDQGHLSLRLHQQPSPLVVKITVSGSEVPVILRARMSHPCRRYALGRGIMAIRYYTTRAVGLDGRVIRASADNYGTE